LFVTVTLLLFLNHAYRNQTGVQVDSFFTTGLCIITISIIIFIFVNENEIVVCNWSCNPFWASCLLLHMGIF